MIESRAWALDHAAPRSQRIRIRLLLFSKRWALPRRHREVGSAGLSARLRSSVVCCFLPVPGTVHAGLSKSPRSVAERVRRCCCPAGRAVLGLPHFAITPVLDKGSSWGRLTGVRLGRTRSCADAPSCMSSH